MTRPQRQQHQLRQATKEAVNQETQQRWLQDHEQTRLDRDTETLTELDGLDCSQELNAPVEPDGKSSTCGFASISLIG